MSENETNESSRMDESIPRLKEIMDEELDDFFSERQEERGGSGVPWTDDEWQEKREEVLDDRCEWCGNEDDLQLHHPNQGKVNWKSVWINVEDEAFQVSSAFREDEHLEKIECCPKCSSRNFYERTTMTPKYRCQNCDHTFHSPGSKPNRKKADAYDEAKLEWIEDSGLKQVRRVFERRYDDYWEKYKSLEETITICRTCHLVWHDQGRKICDECGENYGERRLNMGRRYVCWDCVVEKKGLEKCPECEENWFNPEYNNKCKSCRSRGPR